MTETVVRSESLGRRRVTVALITTMVLVLGVWSGPAHATPPEQSPCCIKVMTYNMYLGANLQPLFAVQDPTNLPGSWTGFGLT